MKEFFKKNINKYTALSATGLIVGLIYLLNPTHALFGEIVTLCDTRTGAQCADGPSGGGGNGIGISRDVMLSATPVSFYAGGSATLTWSASSTTNCLASGSWSGERPISGSESTGVINTPGTYNYKLDCTNNDKTIKSNIIALTVMPRVTSSSRTPVSLQIDSKNLATQTTLRATIAGTAPEQRKKTTASFWKLTVNCQSGIDVVVRTTGVKICGTEIRIDNAALADQNESYLALDAIATNNSKTEARSVVLTLLAFDDNNSYLGMDKKAITVPIQGPTTLTDVDNQGGPSDCLDLKNNLRYRSLDMNTKGEVSALQDFLNTKGFLTAEPTGFFSSATLKAVQNFQSKNEITPNGFVGRYTRAKIRALTCNVDEGLRQSIKDLRNM